MPRRLLFVVGLVAFSLALGARWPAHSQVGKGLIDLNSAPEKDLAALPHLTPPIVKGLIDKHPFATIVEANSYLTSQALTAAQLADLYRKAFVHVNLNTGSDEEILLIPGAGKRMVREFAEYRPWKAWAQFDKEIGKYVGQAETVK
jgi:DNA uptake protein ComE-like DNA-binding protein